MILYVALCLTECRAQTDSVQQPGGDVTAAEGDSVTLGCHFNSSLSNYYLFWYKQEGNTLLQRLDPRCSHEVKDEDKLINLQISSAAVSDSAVYYCAVSE
uniref:Ig-like domain-containing protein n=1 Tax=Oryzias melastigma TaxID=30732 RepID=A0A3B3BJR7_ORYME